MVLVIGLVLAWVTVIFLTLFASLINGLGRLNDGRLRILVSKFRVFGLWISYKSSLGEVFGIFHKLLIANNTLIYF